MKTSTNFRWIVSNRGVACGAWVLLAVLFGFLLGESPAGCAETAAPAALPAPSESSNVEPSQAFPGDTFFYLETSRPVEMIDMLSGMNLWPALTELLDAGRPVWDSLGSVSGRLAGGVVGWNQRSPLRSRYRVLAGERLVVGWLPSHGEGPPIEVVVLQGTEPAEALDALRWIVAHGPHGGAALLMNAEKSGAAKSFHVIGRDGKHLFSGVQQQGWLVLSPPSGVSAAKSVAAALASSATVPPQSLAANREFRQAMAHLPADTNVRAYLDPRRMAAHLCTLDLFSEPVERLLQASVAWMEGLAVARRIEPGTIDTWISGGLRHDALDARFPGLMNAVVPLDPPLTTKLPRNALAVYELGLPADRLLEIMESLLETCAPSIHRAVMRQIESFHQATGLDLHEDLFPFLGRRLAVVWLPAEDSRQSWPLPRKVVVIEVTGRDEVSRFLPALVDWRARALAPSSGGLIGGRVVSESYDGVEMLGIELDSVIRLPLPSPRFAIVGDLLIVSPVASAVKEMITVLHGNSSALSELAAARCGADEVHAAVELIHLNLPLWRREWEIWGEKVVPMIRFFLFDRTSDLASKLDNRAMRRIGKALFDVLGSFERTSGVTVLHDDGCYTFSLHVTEAASER